MKSAADIKKRIKSVANTQQITKAMEVVSATKMRRSQELALKARPYAFAAFELLAAATTRPAVGGVSATKLPPLLTGNNSKKTLAVIIASDKGLAGSLNANVMRTASSFVKGGGQQAGGFRNPSPPEAVLPLGKGEVDIATVGKKGREYFGYRGYNIVKEFTGHGDYVDITEMNELHDFISAKFLDSTYGKVVFVYTNFLSTLRQEPVVREVLPIKRENLLSMIEGLTPKTGKFSELATRDSLLVAEYLFEPSREKVIQQLVDRLFRMQLYHIQLESNASEHSARMVAMKTASDNAGEIVDDLTLIYNKGRQAKITQEIMEITAGSDAIG